MLLIRYDFRGYRSSERHFLIKDLIEFLSVISIFTVRSGNILVKYAHNAV
jgi:hypothetical protein